jgi:peptidoglycan/LPS O-acetylase OafA/YrhL
VLSGFCLFWPLVSKGPDRIKALDLKDYAWRRAKRIAPPYYAAMLVCIVTAYITFRFGGSSWWHDHQPFQDVFPWRGIYTAKDILVHLFLIHGFFHSYTHSIEGAFWSLSLEWQFYWLLPILAWVARRWSVGLACLIPIFATLLFRVSVKSVDSSLVWVDVWNETALARWSEFGCGMIAAAFIGGCLTPRWMSICRRVCGGFCVLAFIAGMIAMALLRDNFLQPVVLGVGCGMVVTYAEKQRSWFRTALEWKPLVGLGTISYSVYLVHGAVFQLMAVPLSRLQIEPNSRRLIFFFLGLPLVPGLSFVFFLIFESPFLKKSRSSGKRIAEPQPVQHLTSPTVGSV